MDSIVGDSRYEKVHAGPNQSDNDLEAISTHYSRAPLVSIHGQIEDKFGSHILHSLTAYPEGLPLGRFGLSRTQICLFHTFD